MLRLWMLGLLLSLLVIGCGGSSGGSGNSGGGGGGIPAAPTGLVATAGNTQVVLTWNAVANATTYRIKRATTSGGPYTTIATDLTIRTYGDTGLTNGTTYYYVASAVNAAGEGGNSNQASATPTTTGGGLTESQKLAFLKAMGEQRDAWRSLTLDEQHANLVAWAKSQAVVEDAGLSSESNTLWVLYTDGTGSFYIDNKVAPEGSNFGGIAQPANDMPEQTKSFGIFSVETYFPKGHEWLVPKLNDPDSGGYNAIAWDYPTIPDVLSMDDAGVIFWEAHAGFSKHKVNGVWTDIFVLVTGEEATAALSSGAYKSYIDAGEVQTGNVDFRNTLGVMQAFQCYAITDRFVAKHLQLSANSMVAIDACQSGSALFANAWKTAKAGTYVGWSENSGAGSTKRMELMFDRLLGSNAADVVPKALMPPERSFDVKTVQQWMQQYGYDQDPTSTADMVFYHFSPSTRMLRPSISRMLLEGSDSSYAKSKLLIEGSFGPQPTNGDYAVTWGGVNMNANILSWNELEGIRIKIPNPPPVGTIQVRRDTRLSNEAPMTEWMLPVKYTMTGQGSLKYVIDFKLKIHADVHGSRYFPEQVPTGAIPSIWHLDDSTATVTASGFYKPDANTTITWSDGVPSRSYDQLDHANSITFLGSFSSASSKIRDFALINTSTYTRKVNGKIQSQPLAFLDGYFRFDIPVNTDTWSIPAGSAPPTQAIGTTNGVSATLTWGPSTPLIPPLPAMPR